MSRFRRRLMGLAALRQAAADDFVRVEFLENISTAYINSGIFGTMDLDFYIEFEPTQLYQNSGNGVGTIFGSRTGLNENVYQLTTFNKNATNKGHFIAAKNYGYNDNRVPTANMFLGGKNIIKKEGLIFTRADGTTFNLTSQSFTTPKTIFIFGCSRSRFDIQEICKFKLYKLQFSKNGTLVRDFIPMYQISTDTYGLWDRVEEKFYTSPNGVKFSGGARVVADANDNLYYLKDYIKCNGTTNTFINLSKFTNLDNVEFEVYSNTAHDNFIGSRSGTPVRNHFQIAKWTNTRIDIAFGQQNPASITSKNTGNKKFKIKLWERIIYLDNEKFYTCPNNTFTTNTVVSLGAVKGLSQPTSARFYWFKWWNKDKDLIYDMIPVQRVSDGVWGMFCKVHLGFYPSNGSAQFTGA